MCWYVSSFSTGMVVPAIDLFGKQRQELVVASLADPNVRPWITVGVLALPVFHHDDARLSAHVSTGCLCTLRWVESRADQLLKQHRNCRLPGWGIGVTLNALYRFGVRGRDGPYQCWLMGADVAVPVSLQDHLTGDLLGGRVGVYGDGRYAVAVYRLGQGAPRPIFRALDLVGPDASSEGPLYGLLRHRGGDQDRFGGHQRDDPFPARRPIQQQLQEPALLVPRVRY